MRHICEKFGFALAISAGLGTATSSHSDTIIHKQTTYFSIGGKTATELDREMQRRGPVSTTTGRRHPGATQIQFNGTATFISENNRCHIGEAKVTLSTKIMLPRWKNRRGAGLRLGLLWDTMSADIKRHEERHAEIARYHARDFEKRILGLPPAPNCSIMKAKVRELSRLAMDEHDKDQLRFDRIEAINFEKRMMRLLKYRMEAKLGR